MSADISATCDIAACRALRRTVFIEEQGVSEADELDDLDDTATHLLLMLNGTPTGTARLLVTSTTLKIGRVCVLASARGQGHGAALIRRAVAHARTLAGIQTVKLGAQTHALSFYDKLGFTPQGPVFDDAGIPHREMILRL